MYENWKILKIEADEKAEEYSQVAEWCNNEQKYHIEDLGVYYAVVKNSEPSEEELKENISNICSNYINNISWKVERYNTQKTLGIETSDTEETYLKILQYMQYCRDFDEQSGEWWKTNPKTFEEWLETLEPTI